MSLLQRLSRGLDISVRQVERRLERHAPPGFQRAGARGHWRAKGPVTPARIARIKRLWGLESEEADKRRLRRIERYIERLEVNLFADHALVNGYRFAEAKKYAEGMINFILQLPTDEQRQRAIQAVHEYLRFRKEVYAEHADERVAASHLRFGGDNAEERKHLEPDAPEMQDAKRNRDKARLDSAAKDLARLGVAKATNRRLAAQMRMPERTFYASFTAPIVTKALRRAYADTATGEEKASGEESDPVVELVRALATLELKSKVAAGSVWDSDAALAAYFRLTEGQFAEKFGAYVDEARKEFDGIMWADRTAYLTDKHKDLANLSHRFAKGF